MRRRDPLVRSALVLVLGGLVVAGRRGLGVTAQEATPAALTAEEMVAALRAYARAGLTRVDVWLFPNTLEGLDAFAPVLERLDRA
jgi:hypothetical protein